MLIYPSEKNLVSRLQFSHSRYVGADSVGERGRNSLNQDFFSKVDRVESRGRFSRFIARLTSEIRPKCCGHAENARKSALSKK